MHRDERTSRNEAHDGHISHRKFDKRMLQEAPSETKNKGEHRNPVDETLKKLTEGFSFDVTAVNIEPKKTR
jgi:hypothetical protein